MNVFELEAKIGLDSDGFETGLKSARDSFLGVEKYANNLAKQVGVQSEKISDSLGDSFEEVNKDQKSVSKTSESEAKRFSDNWGKAMDSSKGKSSSFFSFLKASLAADLIKRGVETLVSGIKQIGQAAIENYAEYEQLVGGVNKIFNTMDSSVILQDANNAWANLNMTANQYLSTIVDVGANFTSTMGDEKGYETAKRGIQAISDYASGTGKSVDELSQKFTMITRSASSYQSIADQFSGILPATSKDFLKQAQSAGILSSKYRDLTKVPVAEYQEAVSLMLEKGVEDLNLTGNTAMETASTLSGSLAAMKATWSNLLTGFADPNQDISALAGNLTVSVTSFGKNIISTVKTMAPRIKDALFLILAEFDILGMLKQLIFGTDWQQIGDTTAEYVASIDWSGAASQLFAMLGAGFGAIGQFLIGLFSDAWNSVVNYFSEWVSSAESLGLDTSAAILAGILVGLGNLAVWIWDNIINPFILGIADGLAGVEGAGERMVDAIETGIKRAWEGLKTWFNNLWDSLFKNRTVDVSINKTETGGAPQKAIGMDYVPYDGYVASLHRGEMILNRSESEAYRRGIRGNSSGITIVQNIQTVPQTPVELAAATRSYFEQARWVL